MAMNASESTNYSHNYAKLLYVSALGHCLKFTLALFSGKINLFHPSGDLRHQRAIWWFDCLVIKICLLGS